MKAIDLAYDSALLDLGVDGDHRSDGVASTTFGPGSGCTAATARSRRRPTRATICSPRWRRYVPRADELEHLVADDLWPLPTYQEMLFIL